MAYEPIVWVNDETYADEDNMNHMEDGIKNSYNVSLLAVSDTAPSECNEGDKYYNTTTNEIYTATGTDTWSEDGEEPLQDILYVVFGEQNTYAYNGIEMLSVGGGSTTKFGDIVVDSIRSKNVLNYHVSERTNFGIKMSMDSTKLFMNGTTTGAGLIYYNMANTFKLKAGTYTFSSSILSGSFTRNSQDIGVYIRNENTNAIIFQTMGAGNYTNNTTITLNEETPIIIYLNGSGSGFVATDLVIGLQIEAGSTATQFSEYQGLGYVSGSNANGNYIKYADGTMIQWGKKNLQNVACTTAWGAFYRSDWNGGITFPIAFEEIQMSELYFYGGTYASFIIMETGPQKTATQPYYVARMTSSTLATVDVGFYAIGRWY